MSQYRVLVSDYPLPEANYRGTLKLTVKELKAMYPASRSWDELDDSVQVLYAEDEAAFQKLNIFEWGGYPYDLDFYAEKSYVYGIEGRWNQELVEQLTEYIKSNVRPEYCADIITFWAGDGEQRMDETSVQINEITPEDLAILERAHCHCVRLI